MKEEPLTHVFVSYVRENSEAVGRLADTLRSFGIETWLDRDQIKPGTRWRDAIRDGIQRGAFFIACFSSEYNERSRSYMNEELTLAIDELRQRPTDLSWFLPVMLNECEIPDRNIGGGDTLRSIQYVQLHDDWDVGVGQILGVIQPGSAVVFQLSRQLSDNSARVRIRAADNLGKMGKLAAQAIPGLLELLSDENETVSAAAADALGNVGIPEKQVIFRLLSITGDDGHSHYPSMHANASLVTFGASAVPALIEALSVDDHRISGAAAMTLIEIGEAAVAPLTNALESCDGSATGMTARVLGEITRTPNSDTSPVPQLIRILQLETQDDYARADAARALGRIGDSTAVPALIDVLEDDNYLCVSAAMALGEIGDAKAVGPLIEVLSNQQKFWVPRGAAAVALGNIGKAAEQAVDALTAALEYDTENSGEKWDERAHEAVVDAINRINDPTAKSTLTGQGYRFEMWGI